MGASPKGDRPRRTEPRAARRIGEGGASVNRPVMRCVANNLYFFPLTQPPGAMDGTRRKLFSIPFLDFFFLYQKSYNFLSFFHKKNVTVLGLPQAVPIVFFSSSSQMYKTIKKQSFPINIYGTAITYLYIQTFTKFISKNRKNLLRLNTSANALGSCL